MIEKFFRNNPQGTLIVLDACRFDYFEKFYENYLSGILTKHWSAASCTIDWLKRTWKGFNDLTYVSAMPGINSLGVPLKGFVAKDRFKEVIDVWDFGWNEELGTVHPEKVNEAVIERTDRHSLVIHYCQPHQPFIGEPRITFRKNKPDMLNLKWEKTGPKILREHSKAKIREAYVGNLKLVLEYVGELVHKLEDPVVVTADHGELLGDGGIWHPYARARIWHPCGRSDRILREVPWFEVTNKKVTTFHGK